MFFLLVTILLIVLVFVAELVIKWWIDADYTDYDDFD